MPAPDCKRMLITRRPCLVLTQRSSHLAPPDCFSASTMDIPGALPAAVSVGALLRDFFLDGTS